MAKNTEKLDYFIAEFETKSVEIVKADDGSEVVEFSGYGAVFDNTDLQDDIIRKGTFASAKAKSTKLLLMHQHRSVPLGIFVELKEDDKGLFVTGKMPLADDRVRGMVEPQMRIGSLNSMSVGFMTEDFSFETIGKGQNARRVRIITKAKLFEISLVTFPANTRARILAVKDDLGSGDGESEEIENMATPLTELPTKIVKGVVAFDREACIASIKAETKSDQEPSSEYGKCFLWHDEKNADMFSSYKMPVVEIGDLLAINFKAVVAAVTAILKGDVDIPESDTNTIKRNINRIYERAGENPPFNNKDFRVGMAELKYCDKADLEYLMKHYSFKSNTAKAAVSSLHETFFEKDSREGNASHKGSAENDRDGDQTAMESIVKNVENLTN